MLPPSEFDAKFFPALRAAFERGLTEQQIEAAMSAARAEHNRQVGKGYMDWGPPIAAIVGAAFRAVSEMETT